MPEITRTSYVIAVPDLQRSAAFYRDVLGFTVHAISDPGWLFFRSGACTIMAGECRDAMPASELGDHSYFAYVEVTEIDKFHESVRLAGAQIRKPLRDEPWGMREFAIVTVDGHRIMFGAPIAPVGAADFRMHAIDHVQLAMPAGQEDVARRFYAGVLGLREVPKPANLAKRGGVWFEGGTLRLHLGVEADFRPAKKAHPALLVQHLDALTQHLKSAGVDVVTDEPMEGYQRVYVSDPFGNRIELLEPIAM